LCSLPFVSFTKQNVAKRITKGRIALLFAERENRSESRLPLPAEFRHIIRLAIGIKFDEQDARLVSHHSAPAPVVLPVDVDYSEIEILRRSVHGENLVQAIGVNHLAERPYSVAPQFLQSLEPIRIALDENRIPVLIPPAFGIREKYAICGAHLEAPF